MKHLIFITSVAGFLAVTAFTKKNNYSSVADGSTKTLTTKITPVLKRKLITVLYIAGADSNNAVYWKDGKEHILPTAKAGVVIAMAASGKNIYFAGADGDKPVYWKNGKEYNLPAQDTSGVEVTTMAASGKDFYIGGYDDLKPVYWKNGKEYFLPIIAPVPGRRKGPNRPNGSVSTMAISGTSIYFAGEDDRRAVYWKNGKENFLDGVVVVAMAISGKDIYFAGHEKYEAVYWKNGKRFSPPLSDEDARITDLAISGKDLYFAGIDHLDNAVYCKNGEEFSLTDEQGQDRNTGSAAKLVALQGKDVYFAGYKDGQAAYWKNGIVQKIQTFASLRNVTINVLAFVRE
jgi:hypothetical protein